MALFVVDITGFLLEKLDLIVALGVKTKDNTEKRNVARIISNMAVHGKRNLSLYLYISIYLSSSDHINWYSVITSDLIYQDAYKRSIVRSYGLQLMIKYLESDDTQVKRQALRAIYHMVFLGKWISPSYRLSPSPNISRN